MLKALRGTQFRVGTGLAFTTQNLPSRRMYVQASLSVSEKERQISHSRVSERDCCQKKKEKLTRRIPSFRNERLSLSLSLSRERDRERRCSKKSDGIAVRTPAPSCQVASETANGQSWSARALRTAAQASKQIVNAPYLGILIHFFITGFRRWKGEDHHNSPSRTDSSRN